jgi:hypothetical protein
MFIVDDIIAARNAGKVTAMLVGAGAAVLLGVMVAETYEHSVPWGLGPQKERLLQRQEAVRAEGFTKGSRAQFALDKSTYEKWDARLQECTALRRAESTKCAADTTSLKTTSATSWATAYRLGRVSCGASNATAKSATDVRSNSSHDAAGVRDQDLRCVINSS